MTGPRPAGEGVQPDLGSGPEAQRAARHRLIARIAGDIGHELKNPIHASVINLELVRKRVTDGNKDDALARLEVVSDQVRRLHGVVEGLLRLLRYGAQPNGAQELDRMVEFVLPLLRAQANSAGVALEWVPAGDGVRSRASAEALGHALVGLVAVAVAVARRGGAGEVRVEGCATPCQVAVSTRGANGAAVPSHDDEGLMELVRRVAGDGGFMIDEGAGGKDVSWSCTVLLEGDSNA